MESKKREMLDISEEIITLSLLISDYSRGANELLDLMCNYSDVDERTMYQLRGIQAIISHININTVEIENQITKMKTHINSLEV